MVDLKTDFLRRIERDRSKTPYVELTHPKDRVGPIIRVYHRDIFGRIVPLLNQNGEPDDLSDSLPSIHEVRNEEEYAKFAWELAERALSMVHRSIGERCREEDD